jgi:hypothetical protein
MDFQLEKYARAQRKIFFLFLRTLAPLRLCASHLLSDSAVQKSTGISNIFR